MYQILVTLSFQEPGNKNFAMNTEVLKFTTLREAEDAFEAIKTGYPKNAIYAYAVKLYR